MQSSVNEYLQVNKVLSTTPYYSYLTKRPAEFEIKDLIKLLPLSDYAHTQSAITGINDQSGNDQGLQATTAYIFLFFFLSPTTHRSLAENQLENVFWSATTCPAIAEQLPSNS